MSPVSPLVEHYRNLVSALLTHTNLDDEGTEQAIADFRRAGYRGSDHLHDLIRWQQIHYYESTNGQPADWSREDYEAACECEATDQ